MPTIRLLTALALFSLLITTSDAALLGRTPLTPGGTDYQAYYDTVLNVTWLGDANFAATSGYDSDGLMTWPEAQAWLVSLNMATHLGVGDWRQPIVIDTGASGCNPGFIGTDCGFNVDLQTGEMAHLFYNTLGNVGAFNVSGDPTGCGGNPSCLVNSGPFSNLLSDGYWSSIEYAPDLTFAWSFFFRNGNQDPTGKTALFRSWPVRNGDIAGVPLPASVWLLGSALGVLGWLRRKAG